MSFLARAERAGPLWAAVLGIASHAAALSGGLIWLDHSHIEEGLALARPGALLSLFSEGFAGTGFYRPLLALSLSLDAAVSGSASTFHAVTLGFHGAAAALLVVAARSLGASSRAALIAGLLFAVHPATSLVASAIAFRSEAMALVCLLSLVNFHLRRYPVLSALALAAGALSKETAWLLAPLFIGALELSARGSERTPNERRATRVLLFTEGLSFALVSALRFFYAPEHRASFPALTLDEHVGTRLAALGKGFLRLIVPFSNSVCDAFPASPSSSPLSLLGAACLFLLLVTRFASRRPLWLLLLALLPSLQLVPIMRWWSPHYFYIPLAFAALLVADLVDAQLRRPWPAVAFVLVPFSAVSWVESRRYRDDTSLWAPEVALQPACREGHFYLGEAARKAREFSAAAAHYERAARATPGTLSYVDELAAYENLGAVELALNRLPQARSALERALQRASAPERRRRVLYDLALVALRSNEPAEAVRLLAPEANADVPLPEALLLLARALHDLDRESEAQQILHLLSAARAGVETIAARP